MAQPGGEGFEEVLRRAEGLVNDINEAAKAVRAVETEAKRVGGKLTLPQPGVPRLEPKRAVPQEVSQYEGLTKAIEVNERALRRLNDLRKTAEPLRAKNLRDLSLEERATLKVVEAEIRRAQRAQVNAREQVNVGRRNLAGEVGGTQEFREAEVKRVVGTIRDFVKRSIADEVQARREGELEKIRTVQQSADVQVARANEVARALRVIQTESGRFQVHGPVQGEAGRPGLAGVALQPEDPLAGAARTKTFKTEEAAQRELQLIAQQIAADERHTTRVLDLAQQRENAQEAETAVAKEQVRSREDAITSSQARMLQRAGAEGAVRFDPGFNRKQMEDALALQERGLLAETFRTQGTTKRNASVGFGLTEAGLREVAKTPEGLEELRSRAEVAERELDDAKARLRRARNPQRVSELQTLVDVYERDLRVFREVEAAKTVAVQEESAKRVEALRAAGANQFETPIGPRREDRLASDRRAGAIGPEPPLPPDTLEERLTALRQLDSRLEALGQRAAALGPAPALEGAARDVEAQLDALQSLNTRLEDLGRRAEALGPPVDIEALRSQAESLRPTSAFAETEVRKGAVVREDTEARAEAERRAAAEKEALRATAPASAFADIEARKAAAVQGIEDVGRAAEVAAKQVNQITLRPDAAARTRQLKAELRDIGQFTVRSDQGGARRGPSTAIFGADAEVLERGAQRLEQAGLSVARSLEHGFITVTQAAERVQRAAAVAPPPPPPPTPPPTAPPPPPPREPDSATQRAIDASRQRQAQLRERSAQDEINRAQAAAEEEARAAAQATAREAARIPQRGFGGAQPDLRQAVAFEAAFGSTLESIRADLRASVQAPQALARFMEELRTGRAEAPRIPTDDLRAREQNFAGLTRALAAAQGAGGAREVFPALTDTLERLREQQREQQRQAPTPESRARAEAIRPAIPQREAGIPTRDLRTVAIPSRDLRAVLDLERALDGVATVSDEARLRAIRLRDSLAQVIPEQPPAAAGGGRGAAPPPRPPAPPTPPTPPTPPPPPRAPGPEDPRFIAGQEFLSEKNVRLAYQTAQAAQLAGAGFTDAAHGIRAYEQAFGAASSAADTHNQRLREAHLEVARSTSEYAAFSNEMRKHGAATTEFLTALAQGRTTIGEIGFQAAATAGKFAAWTVASVGVYGALTTLSAVGRGAIDSMSGVNQLSRFINDLDTGRAQEQFRALSAEFNMPIADVTEAFATMGKTVHDQEGAFQATRQVLLAMRVGELDLASSTKFFSSILQGLQLPVSALPTVIDQVNQAQNSFNLSIKDGAAGIGRAAGLWKAAAGDGEAATQTFSTLLAVMTTAQRSTGATGEVVGNALRRSAEFVGRERNRLQLRGFGIDPDQGISAIFRQSFAKVQTGQVQGQDITRLATALSSPQLASIIGPTLQNFQLFNKVLAQTNAEASRGSAQRELAITLDAIREKASRVVHELERLGAALGQAGAFDAVGGLLTLINEMLKQTTELVNEFASLPDPIRKSLLYFTELYGVVRLLRRLNLGESLAAAGGAATPRSTFRRPFGTFIQRGGEPLGQALSNPADRQRLRELRSEEDARIRILKVRRESQAREASELADQRARAVARTGELQAEKGPSRADVELFGRSEAQRRFNAQVRLAVAEEERLLELEQASTREVRRTNDEIIHRTERQAQVGQISRRRPGKALDVFEQDELFPVTQTVRTSERPSPGQLAEPIRPGQLVLPLRQVEAPPGVREESARQAAAITAEVGEATTREAIVGATAGTAAAADRVGLEASRKARAIAAAGRGLKTAGLAIRGLGAALGAFLGPLEIALLGVMFLPDILQHFQKQAEARRQEAERLRVVPLDPGEQQRQLDDANKRVEAFTKRQTEQRAANRGRFVPDVKPNEVEQAALEAQRRRDNTAAVQSIARRFGQPIPGLLIEQIQPGIEKDIAAFKRGDKGARGATEIYARYHAEIAQSVEAGEGSRAKLAQASKRLADLKSEDAPQEEIDAAKEAVDRASQAYEEVAKAKVALDTALAAMISPQAASDLFRTENLPELVGFLQEQAGLMQQFGATRQGISKGISAYVAAFAKFASSGLKRGAQLPQIQAAQAAFESEMQTATDDFKKNLAAASTPRQRRAVLTTGLGDLRAQIRRAGRDVTQADDAVDAAGIRREQAKTVRDRAAAALRRDKRRQPFGSFGLGPASQELLGGTTAQSVLQQEADRSQKTFDQAQARFDRATQIAKNTRVGRTKALEGVAKARKEMIDAYLDPSGQEISALRLRIAEARGTPMEAATARLRAARSQERAVKVLVAEGLLKNKDATIALLSAAADTAEAAKAQDEAGNQQIEDTLSRMDRLGQIRTLRLPEAQRGGATLQNLRAQFQTAKNAGADEKTLQDLTIQILTQENSNADDAKQRAQDAEQKRQDAIQKQRTTVESIFNLRRSRTDNPVSQARLTVDEINTLLGIPGLTTNDRRDLQARKNEAIRDSRRAVSDERLRSLDLEHDIGQISDSAYLAGLKRLMNAAAKGTQLRKELREKFLRTKHEMESSTDDLPELNVGNIRLPTAYDVKRLIRQGTRTAPQSTVNQSNTINIDARGSDPEAISAHIGRHLSTQTRSGMRAAGLRG
jgi:TP901 family phage tail tape measure protein